MTLSFFQRVALAFTPVRKTLAVDVAGYQEGMAWASVPDWRLDMQGTEAQVGLAIVKATQGITPNAHAEYHALGAQAIGLPVQYYHFATPYNIIGSVQNDAKREAEEFVKKIRSLPKPARIVYRGGAVADVWLDWEHVDEKPLTLNKAECRLWLNTFLALVESAGLQVGFYGGVATWAGDFGQPYLEEIRTRPDGTLRPWWAPGYGKNDGKVPPKESTISSRTPGPFWPVAIWQFSSTVKAPFLKAKQTIDVNIAYILRIEQ